MNSMYTEKVIDAIQNYLKTTETKYYYDEKKCKFTLPIRDYSELKLFWLNITARENGFFVTCNCPIGVDYSNQHTIQQMIQFQSLMNEYCLFSNEYFYFNEFMGTIKLLYFWENENMIPTNLEIYHCVLISSLLLIALCQPLVSLIFKDMSAEEVFRIYVKEVNTFQNIHKFVRNTPLSDTNYFS